MYADDCMLYCTGNNWLHVFNKLQHGLINFDTWCVRNSMVLNVSKSKCLGVELNCPVLIILNDWECEILYHCRYHI